MKRLIWISKSFAIALLSIGATSLLTACNEFQPKDLPDAVVAADAAQKEKTEKAPSVEDPEGESVIRADEGEDLLNPQTIEQAEEKFKEAIQLDDKNGRAHFWLEWIKVIRETKGILNRIRPIYDSVPNGATRYVRFMNETEKRLSPSSRRYLLDGPKDIQTMDEFQEWMDRLILRLSDLRNYIKTNKHNEIRIRIPTNFIYSLGVTPSYIDKGKMDCQSSNFGPVTIQLGNCAYQDVALNRADFEALQTMVGYYEMFFSVLNAYRLNPTIFVTNGKMEYEEFFKELVKSDFGTLRKEKQRIPVIKEMTSDLIISFQYMIDHERENCKKGFASKSNRPGYLIETGFCFSHGPDGKTTEERTISLLEKFLAGDVITSESLVENVEKNWNEPEIRYPWAMYPLRIVENPPADLETIFDVKINTRQCTATLFSEKGMAPYMVDGKLGGLGFKVNDHEFHHRCEANASPAVNAGSSEAAEPGDNR